ncbi:MAG: glycine--tRNA ligase subunit beta [Pseudomonadales bacterium]|nr:glycine--tRNA ligase subunit beta [Pseudomonadales bacterium]NRA15768.1 glycine--tRNA ligase subunit beta [Oceanospirillaceae bacterium]
MATVDFLVELGTAELPPISLQKLSKAFSAGIMQGLKAELGKDAQTLLAACSVENFATPRRLAVKISGLIDEIPASVSSVQGPPLKICYDADGNPSKALIGFAKKNSVELEQLSERDGKINYTQQIAAKPLAALMPGIVEHSLSELPIAKRMRWGANKIEFVRPVQWLVMLFDERVIDCEILGVQAGNQTRGHRFHHQQPITINNPAEYEAKLQRAYVIANFSKRRDKIVTQVKQQAELINCIPHIEDDLLDEVTGLNEWPVALTGAFDKEFLSVPQEALILSMKEHQKYFYTTDEKGQLMPNFITISNIESKDVSKVIAGNEKVIRPRLADANFFFENDKKISLESRCEKLKKIIFQQQLGTVYAKSQRNAALASHIAGLIQGDQQKAQRAALLAKTDLVTDMVFEFTDLQGLMGYHYALNDGEDTEVAQAIFEQYLPKFAGDQLPATKTGLALALADRLDTLTGMFGIGQPPTGSKDPFALRRATVGVLRIIIEQKLDLDLKQLVELSVAQHEAIAAEDKAKVAKQVVLFMLERLRAYYEDGTIRIDTYLAVAALAPSRPLDFDQRVNAVEHFRSLAAAQSLTAANKRVSNILDKQSLDKQLPIDSALLTEAAEIELDHCLTALDAKLMPMFESSDYRGALTLLASLQQPIDHFFDNVMVMAEDPAVQKNRLALLQKLRQLFLRIADISLLN